MPSARGTEMYVIKHNETGRYVSLFGNARSYTDQLQRAQVFGDLVAAERSVCANEHITLVQNEFGLVRHETLAQTAEPKERKR